MASTELAHYTILEQIGEGGMGVVYKARDNRLNRTVVLKALKVTDRERQRRLVQEAQTASQLNHQNITAVYDFTSMDGADYLVMEYVPGRTLGQVIPKRGMRLNDALKYAIQIADAVAAAHAAGIVHRDLKPGNIMITDNGIAKVLDFGLAKVDERARPENDATQTVAHTAEGTIVGTVAYMSPEQAQGDKLDTRSDVFSFGAVLYEMVTGARPFQGDKDISTLTAILRDEPKQPSVIAPDTPPELERIIARCLRKQPERRYQAIADVRIALEDLKLESESGQVKRPLAATSRNRLRLWQAVSAVSVVIAVAAVAGWWMARAASARDSSNWRIRPVTWDIGMEGEPALSPDGNQLAYTLEDGPSGPRQVYVRLVDGGAPVRLTNDTDMKSFPSWAPDGKRIAFTRHGRQRGGVIVIPALGGTERRIGDLPPAPAILSRMAWSPDGTVVAVGGIEMIHVDTGERWKASNRPATYLRDVHPVFSLDGSELYFARHKNVFNHSVVRVALNKDKRPSGAEQMITAYDRTVDTLELTRDGESLLFSSPMGTRVGIFSMPVSGGEPKALVLGAELATAASIARRADRLAYAAGDFDENLWLAPVDGSAPARLAIASTRQQREAQFSIDGERVVFTSMRTGYREVWTAKPDGSEAVQVTTFQGTVRSLGSPRWSPDRRSIAFDVYAADNSDIYVVNAEGGRPRQVTSEASDEIRPSWSRDGKWIYFGSNRTGRYEIWRMPAAGGPVTQVSTDGGLEAHEAADRNLYFSGPDNLGLWSMSEGARSARQVAGSEVRTGHWAVAGRRLYFRTESTRTEPQRILSIDLDTGKQRSLLTLSQNIPVRPSGTSISVSQDERWILFGQIDRQERDIMLVDGFR
jgi:serine/threonine protein kinase/WD40 repeat protein